MSAPGNEGGMEKKDIPGSAALEMSFVIPILNYNENALILSHEVNSCAKDAAPSLFSIQDISRKRLYQMDSIVSI